MVALAACGADEAEQAVISQLAVGSWECAPDEPIEGDGPLTVRIDEDGTFGVTFEPAAGELVGPAGGEFTGTWAIVEGDLAWSFDRLDAPEPFVVRDFDDLGLDSVGFTLENAGAFEAHDGVDDPTGQQDFDVEVHDKDSVTLSIPGGTPWTCERQ